MVLVAAIRNLQDHLFMITDLALARLCRRRHSSDPQRSMIKWWAIILAGAAATLLFAWLGRMAGVPLSTLLSITAGGVALAWLVVLVTVPWNLYFAARRAVAEMADSRERGITVRAAYDAEAGRLAQWMLRCLTLSEDDRFRGNTRLGTFG